MIAPEFSRPQRLDQIGAGEADVTVTADPAERAALAKRFALIAIDRLEARYAIRRDAQGVRATGHLSAAVTQSCVATADPVPATVEEDFDLRFVPEQEVGEEIELSEDECDVVFFTGTAIDLGEAAAETLLLALDPFPRSPKATAALKAAGVISEDEVQPFNAFAGLKAKLEKKG